MKWSENVTGFDWDKGNIDKNYKKHKVTRRECEEIFFNECLFVFEDIRHSHSEIRYYGLGRTNEQRLIFLVFTVRSAKIRVISARDMNKKERGAYYEKVKKGA